MTYHSTTVLAFTRVPKTDRRAIKTKEGAMIR